MQTFDRTTWALLNAHRDVLRELNLYLDDLYGWTPLRLREEILGRVLDLGLEIRRKILRHWIYRTEDRRSQILSLLAANTFRPRSDFEDDWGDDPRRLKVSRGEKETFAVAKSCLWFLDLCIGFYLPQVLIRNRYHEIPKGAKGTLKPRVWGIGWSLMNGPIQAVRELLEEREIFANGMMLLAPKDLEDLRKKTSVRRFIDVWCYHGYEGDVAWAAVSLWRGLGLLGELLRLYERYCRGHEDDVDTAIRELLAEHMKSARLTGSRRSQAKPRGEVIRFKAYDIEKRDETLSKEIKEWLKWTQEESCVTPAYDKEMATAKIDEEAATAKIEAEGWKSCFFRRIHGNQIMGDLWNKIEAVRFDVVENGHGEMGKPNPREEMYPVLKAWLRIVIEYWPRESLIRPLVANCPFISPLFSTDEKSGLKLVRKFQDSKELPIEERLKGLQRVPWEESPPGVEEAERKASTVRSESGSGKTGP